MKRLMSAAAATLLLAGCQLVESYRYCSELPPAQLSAVPARLSETGLYADLRAGGLAPGVLPYRPQFELWSDGASKRRWIWLPPGTRIDTSDMDSWQFPEGTRLWKEFSRDASASRRACCSGSVPARATGSRWPTRGTTATARPSP